jgi:Fe-S oxidoreductase
VSIPDIVRAMRRILVDYGSMPAELKPVISKIFNQGNPLGAEREKRSDWAKGLDVKAFEPSMEYLYFSCCIPAYDARGQGIARATAEILNRASVSYGILGSAESCCSEAIRRAGAEKVFQEVAKSNLDAFHKAGVRKILATSPHCYSTFKLDYPEIGGDFEVVHVTQLFAELLREGRLTPKKPLDKRVVYHDPCTLGRQNSIYEEPREVLQSIPGLELVEFEPDNREFSVCCGGGSGGLWLDWPKGERLSDHRVEQAVETGAEILAVACPYCLSMFEDSVKTMGVELEVKDVSELLRDSLA